MKIILLIILETSNVSGAPGYFLVFGIKIITLVTLESKLSFMSWRFITFVDTIIINISKCAKSIFPVRGLDHYYLVRLDSPTCTSKIHVASSNFHNYQNYYDLLSSIFSLCISYKTIQSGFIRYQIITLSAESLITVNTFTKNS